MMGQWPYIEPVLRRLSDNPRYVVCICRTGDRLDRQRLMVHMRSQRIGSIPIVDREDVRSVGKLFPAAAFLTCEQFSDPVCHPAICFFHGQPSKGLTFNQPIVDRFEHFCLIGPLHEQALREHLQDRPAKTDRRSGDSNLPHLHRCGYPKSDWVIHQNPNSDKQIPQRPKRILYAPAFNERATLRTIGLRLITAVAKIDVPDNGNIELIVKLAPDSMESTNDIAATGGVDWQRAIDDLKLPNVVVVKDLAIDKHLLWADVMVTDVSGVALEMLALGKPVIYFDCPEFYRSIWEEHHRHIPFETFLCRQTVSGLRDVANVVSSIDELTDGLRQCLLPPDRNDMQRRLLYNPGAGTEAVLDVIDEVTN